MQSGAAVFDAIELHDSYCSDEDYDTYMNDMYMQSRTVDSPGIILQVDANAAAAAAVAAANLLARATGCVTL